MYGDDPSADLEALLAARLDVDLEMAEMEAEGDRYWDQVKRYEQTGDPADCPHGGGVSYANPPFRPEQKGLKPAEMRCGTCHTAVPDPVADLRTS